MTIFGLRRHSRGLGLSPRRARHASGGQAGDTQAPTVPQNLNATAVSDDQIDLTWQASTDNVGVTGYNIYRDNVLIDTSPTNSYSNTGLSPGTYQYEVSAFDAASNESPRSNPNSATVPILRLMPEFIARGAVTGGGVETVNTNNVGFTYQTEDVRADDLFIAVIAVNDRGATPDVADTASGWTKIGEVAHSELRLSAFYKQATGSESGAVIPFDWSSGDGANDVAICQVFRFRYVDWTNGGPFVGSIDTKTGNLTSLTMPSVTTQGLNGLAIAVVGMSDNVTLATPTGQSGGTWIAPHNVSNTTQADDATVGLFQAAMASAGTISGGATTITPTTPQSSRSAAIGFALRGMVDPANYNSLSVPIAASADDARENTGSTVVTVNSTTLFGSGNIIGLRFTGLAAIKGKTIVQANLQVTASANEGAGANGTATYVLKAEAADTAAQYVASNGNISSRSLTTASRTWDLPGWTANDRTARQRSPDVRTLVQEVSDRAGFGGVLNFILSGSGQQFAAWDHATLQEATLTVRYLP
jgi:hypothetical protein